MTVNRDQQAALRAMDATWRTEREIAARSGLHPTRASAVLVGLTRLGCVDGWDRGDGVEWRRTPAGNDAVAEVAS